MSSLRFNVFDLKKSSVRKIRQNNNMLRARLNRELVSFSTREKRNDFRWLKVFAYAPKNLEQMNLVC